MSGDRRDTLRWVAQPMLLLALVCAAPFLAFYSGNMHEGLGFMDLGVYWLGLVGIAWAIYGVAFGLMAWIAPVRSFRLSAIWATALILFLAYRSVAAFFLGLGWSDEGQLAGWFALVGAGVFLAAVFGGRPAFHQFLLLFAALALLPSLWRIASWWQALPDQGPGLPLAQAYPLAGNDIWSGQAVRTPNIYWIVSDSYPNAEQLLAHYGLDNETFLRDLESRGFYVARDAHSNFSNTRLSVPTMLNMEYTFETGEEYAVRIGDGWAPKPGRTNSGTVAAIAGDNRSVAFIKQLGYSYVHFEGRSFALIRCRGYEDVCIASQSAGFSELELSLLELVPYDLVLQYGLGLPKGTTPARTRAASGTGIPELADAILALEVEGPLFLYAHLSSPHPPFLADENCKVGALPASRKSLGRNVRCVNRQLLALVDRLQASDPDAILILSADHGPRMTIKPGTPLFRWSPLQVREALGILNAFRLPEDCRRGLSPSLTPVNTMRIVFACLGGHAPRLLAPKHFVVRGGPPDGGKIRRVTIR